MRSARAARYASPMSPVMSDLLRLSVPERIQLVQDLWDSIAADESAVALTDAQRAELDRRLDAHRRDPDAARPWAEVKARLLGER